MIQYDNNGLGYQFHQSFGAEHYLCCYKGKDCLFWVDDVTNKSSVISEILEKQYGHFTSSWYVGFGGNIYYYIAGEKYTEVFRIRRTWGDPDFYAMAINGYTDDEYGKYVDEVLPSLSKSDLRLLRNTIFALYGVHFKSQDLSNYFDKQVWYTDEGKTSADVQKLCEVHK